MTYTPILASLTIFTASLLASCSGTKTQQTATPSVASDSATVVPEQVLEQVTEITDTILENSLLNFESLTWSDSITSLLDNKSHCYINVDYPRGELTATVDSIRAWIASQFDYFTFNGDLSDGQRLIAEAGQSFIDSARNDFAEFDTLDIKNISYADDYSIAALYRTDSTLTYANSMYWDRGGAHGASPFRVAVFNLNNGQRLGWDMFQNDKLDTVRLMVRNAIKTQAFETDSDEEFNEILMLPDSVSEFPFSVQPPYFMADGVHVVYQQYEIAPYACGLPGCTIPYSDLYDYFTPEVRRLIPEKSVAKTRSIK